MVVAGQLTMVHSEFSTAASNIGDAYRGSAAQAQEAIARMSSQIEHSANVARSASKDLSVKFKSAYWIVLISAAVVALLIGNCDRRVFCAEFRSSQAGGIQVLHRAKCADPPVKPKRK